MNHLRDADLSAGAGNVDDDDGILEKRRRFLGEHAEEPVCATAGSGGHDELDRLGDGERSRAEQQRRSEYSGKSHDTISSVLAIRFELQSCPADATRPHPTVSQR